MKRWNRRTIFKRGGMVFLVGIFFSLFLFSLSEAEETPWTDQERSVHNLTKNPNVPPEQGTPTGCFFAWDVSLEGAQVAEEDWENLNQIIVDQAQVRIYTQPHSDENNRLTPDTLPPVPRVDVLEEDLKSIKEMDDQLAKGEIGAKEITLFASGSYEGPLKIWVHWVAQGPEEIIVPEPEPEPEEPSKGEPSLSSKPNQVNLPGTVVALDSWEGASSYWISEEFGKEENQHSSHESQPATSPVTKGESPVGNNGSDGGRDPSKKGGISLLDQWGLVFIFLVLSAIVVFSLSIVSDLRVLLWYRRKG